MPEFLRVEIPPGGFRYGYGMRVIGKTYHRIFLAGMLIYKNVIITASHFQQRMKSFVVEKHALLISQIPSNAHIRFAK